MTHEPVSQTAPVAPSPRLPRAVRDGLIGGVGLALFAVFSTVLRGAVLDTPPLSLALSVIGVALMVLSFGLSASASLACVAHKQPFFTTGLLWFATALISGLVFNFLLLMVVTLLLRAAPLF